MNKYDKLEEIVGKDKVKYNEKMSKYTTMRVGGPCDCIVFPDEISKIKEVIDFCKNENITFFVIGNGSNLLVKDEGIHGVVIKLGHRFSKIELDGEYILAYAGATMPALSQLAKKNSLKGLEFACGIPGTIGGGVKMNAGAYGSQISDILYEVTYMDEKEEIKTIKNKDCSFGYRKSIFTINPNYVILSAKFKLERGNIDEIENKMKENSLARKAKQPLEYPNFGSVFKRPEGYFVGKLVDDAGLRGYKIGGAQVSTKHTGFIVNVDNATCKDVLDLIGYVQTTVYNKFNVKLTPEVIIIGGDK
ncbi:uDP-N-acetylenolpyruvoylglucosamine reductase [Clostridium sp. CAG:465]|nr:uDP-N-acetylenolpyruvoylglucosamine reductase [Clostridium sp. CAG:465]